MKRIVGLSMTLFLVFLLMACNSSSVDTSKKPIDNSNLKTEQVSSDSLKETIITSYLNQEIKEGKNLIYCSSFQLAWDSLKKDVLKENVMLKDAPPMVDYLNKTEIGRNVSENCRVTMAGFIGDGIVDKINTQLKSKFKNPKLISSQYMGPDDILAYAFLYKKLEFENKFYTSDLTIKTGKDKSIVKCFGIEQSHSYRNLDHLLKQFSILDYINDDDFIIQLHTKSEDEIYLAKINPQKTLDDTVKFVNERIKNGQTESFSSDSDSLLIPVISFNIKHEYKELAEKAMLNKKYPGYYIASATQDTLFHLDESGVELKSEASMSVAAGIPISIKNLVFDKPFLIFLKEKGEKTPYFAAWIANPELMQKIN